MTREEIGHFVDDHFEKISHDERFSKWRRAVSRLASVRMTEKNLMAYFKTEEGKKNIFALCLCTNNCVSDNLKVVQEGIDEIATKSKFLF